MKKILTYIVLSAALVLNTSCLEDLTSKASLDANMNLAENDVNTLLTGLYKSVRNPNNYGYFSIMCTEIMSDNYRPYKFQWFQVQNLFEHKVPSNDILLGYNYSSYYQAIDRANTILGVPSATDAQKAAAKFYRAYTYLRLYDMYERVPLIDVNYKGGPIAPSSKEDVLKFILDDLKFAKEHLPEFDLKNPKGSMKLPNKEGAAAVLARVLRIKGDIQAAGAEAEYVINTNKFSISPNPKERDGEVIVMLKGNKAEGVGSWGWIMSYDAKTWNCFGAADDLVALISDEDTRRILFDFAKKDERQGFVFSNKYKTEDNSDLVVARIPEMYLISAEAGNANRLQEFQKIRKSKLQLKDERRLEMSFEWTRWEDMKLEGLTDYVLPYPQGAKDSNPLLK
ncbi:RagB/SusD family nutrient uptake outer membrane protein [Ornithobacterium rhinotracheale]